MPRETRKSLPQIEPTSGMLIMSLTRGEHVVIGDPSNPIGRIRVYSAKNNCAKLAFDFIKSVQINRAANAAGLARRAGKRRVYKIKAIGELELREALASLTTVCRDGDEPPLSFEPSGPELEPEYCVPPQVFFLDVTDCNLLPCKGFWFTVISEDEHCEIECRADLIDFRIEDDGRRIATVEVQEL